LFLLQDKGEKEMEKKIIRLEDRVPKLKEQRKQKTNRRVIIYISFFFALVLIIIYTQSSLSNISKIEVTGNRNVSEKKIITLSNLSNKTNYWKLNEDQVIQGIKTDSEIKDVSLHRKFPSTVVIQVKEYRRVAYIIDKATYIPISETGKVLNPLKASSLSSDAPLLIGWENPEMIEEMTRELLKLPESIANAISEIHHTPVKLEPSHITLFMNDGQEVSTTIRDFPKSMIHYPNIKQELDPNAKGILFFEYGDYSFKTYESLKQEDTEKDK
jgi:cell division protein FtsQ